MKWKNLLPDFFVEIKYVLAGGKFGELIKNSPSPNNESCFEKLLNNWGVWEKEYAKRGYRTINLDRLTEYKIYEKPLNDVLRQKRELNENIILYSKKYESEFYKKMAKNV